LLKRQLVTETSFPLLFIIC